MERKKIIFLTMLFIAIVGFTLSPTFAYKNEKVGYVTKVVDGDTIYISGLKNSIRLWGIDTPELKTSAGKKIKSYVNKLLLGKRITLDIDDKKNHDKYGRWLAKVYYHGKDVNKLLLNKKYARVMYIPPSEFKKYTGGLGNYQFNKLTTKRVKKPSSNDRWVYIAPYSGQKYHFDRNCRGLKHANVITKVRLSWAIKHGYTLCGWED